MGEKVKKDQFGWMYFESLPCGFRLASMDDFHVKGRKIEGLEYLIKRFNQDSGGFEVGLEGSYPGIEKAVQKWIQNLGIDFKGLVIIQNGTNNRKYMIEEKDNLAHSETIDTTWGEEIDKDKGHKFSFVSKQGSAMAFYEGELLMDTTTPVGG